jgi:hypothetical protein
MGMREDSISPELISLAMRPHERTRECTTPVASTFNPKVAGSIPARPIVVIRARFPGAVATLLPQQV